MPTWTSTVVVVSNGFQKFHLAALAAELHARGRLQALHTGAYPAPSLGKLIANTGLGRLKRLQRLLARAEAIEPSLINSHATSEALYQIARHLPNSTLGTQAAAAALALYCRSAARQMLAHTGDRAAIFHYRSGFGGQAAVAARRRRLLTICDHSTLHPAYMDQAYANAGTYDPAVTNRVLDPFWARVVADFERADSIVVNSEFVRDSFLQFGILPQKVSTIYLGVDDAFYEAIPVPSRGRRAPDAPLVLLFAASLCDSRKGTDILLDAFRQTAGAPLELRIAGSITPGLLNAFGDVFQRPNVVRLGLLSRAQLATQMADADIFVFPSLAEGSARVVFEAMACGCFVITTPNSGSIVKDRIHGRLVPPGNALSLEDAIRGSLAARAEVAATGVANAHLVRNHYRQQNYGDHVLAFYDRELQRCALPTQPSQ